MVLKMKTFCLFVVVLLSVEIVAAQVKYSTYTNRCFGYSLQYPSTLRMQPADVTGSGRIFLSKDKDIEMGVWAHYNSLYRSVEEEFDEELKRYGNAISYKRILKNGFVVSGVKDGTIFYQKTLYHKFKSTDVYFTFTIEYPSERYKLYNAIVVKMSRSFRFNPYFDV